MESIIMTGTLYPEDRNPGCLFQVCHCGPNQYKVTLISPYTFEVVTQEIVKTMVEVGKMLLGLRDY